ncbi:hypothetical protein FIE12Z_13059 [Fusarium flagelliforme]|uniref:Uncharacterized protein n=1 Tax=Fusarium flagelliforme TaxID=2675880 RepID=A0A395M4C4_9HYPO|nr:hypothetical protein FIE12Z_13059 [Fusarium flagelliforme]
MNTNHPASTPAQKKIARLIRDALKTYRDSRTKDDLDKFNRLRRFFQRAKEKENAFKIEQQKFHAELEDMARKASEVRYRRGITDSKV